MSIKEPSTEPSINREPSNYTATNGVRHTVRDNPIPSEMIGDCIRYGEVVYRASSNPMKVTLRYEEGTNHIELHVDLGDGKVISLSSSYERDWQEGLN